MANIRGAQGSERILVKLRNMISNAEYYEAHQLYRTLVFRYTNSKKFNELRQLLFEGASLFFEKEQFNSAADMSGLYLNAVSSDPDITEETAELSSIYQKIGELFSKIPDKTPERMHFVLTALKLDPKIFDLSAIHREFALALLKEKNYPESRYHFVHSSESCSDECAQMLVEFQISDENAGEVDFCLAQLVLQLLCIKNKSSEIESSNGTLEKDRVSSIGVRSRQHAYAIKTFISYVTKHPRITKKSHPYDQPLLNMVWNILVDIESGDADKFKSLCEEYDDELSKETSFKALIGRIGQLYFGLKPPPKNTGLGGIFGNLLQSLMDDNEDAEEVTATPVKPVPTISRTVEVDNDLD
ncbi:Golgi to ER traffic protein 4 -like protein [Halotydeus destructor]|nr:Golgi to ER traffic protein 4 -like protein [Halotydeus destructor]